jgi:hypothetical protein
LRAEIKHQAAIVSRNSIKVFQVEFEDFGIAKVSLVIRE